MSRDINVAMIGGGRVARHHCQMLAEVSEVKITAICELREDRGLYLATEYGVPYFNNYHKMLSEIFDIDIVTIATPSGMHFEHAREIIDLYEKNIVVEKPTFMRPEQMREVYALAEKRGRKIFPVYQNRYNKAVDFVRQAIDVDPEGNIFGAETYNQRVQRLSSNGEFLGYIGNKFFSVDTPEDLQKLIHATANDKLISRYRN